MNDHRLLADDCELDLGRCEARRAGRCHGLTPREVGILRWLAGNADRVVSRAELLEAVWGMRGDLATRRVDMAVVGLRKKVERDPTRPRLIVSVKGAGYVWGPRDEAGATSYR